MKTAGLPFAFLCLVGLASCDQRPTAEIHAPGVKARKQVVEVEPIESGKVVVGQTIYVPAYSAVYTSDRAHRFELAITLSIRNTDQDHPIFLTAARYHDQDGQRVRDHVKKPIRIGPMASIEYFVSESDTSGGVSASFLVDWVAEQSVTAPVVESIMVGTLSTQGVSFTCPGRVLQDRNLTGSRDLNHP